MLDDVASRGSLELKAGVEDESEGRGGRSRDRGPSRCIDSSGDNIFRTTGGMRTLEY